VTNGNKNEAGGQATHSWSRSAGGRASISKTQQLFFKNNRKPKRERPGV
jgi:hypothetical protein